MHSPIKLFIAFDCLATNNLLHFHVIFLSTLPVATSHIYIVAGVGSGIKAASVLDDRRMEARTVNLVGRSYNADVNNKHG